MDPVKIIKGALDALQAEDEPHRSIHIEAVESECQRLLGGCRCERRLAIAGHVEGDIGEAGRMLNRILHNDLVALARFGDQPGMAEGLAVIASQAERLAGRCVATETD